MQKMLNKLQVALGQDSDPIVVESKYREIYNSYLTIGQKKNNPDFFPFPDYDLSKEDLPIKIISFYLPQFHPIPENDEWWGRGFTEWINVSKAVPNFVGHYQPHLPGEMGFYDLRIKEVQHRQVQLAKKFGIFGFCFYYYWFNGKKLLERPLEQFAADNEIDFPFCICWANENWTRRWDGLAEEILIAQDHNIESDIALIRDIVKYLKSERYIKINNCPVLIVYRPHILPNPKRAAMNWRKYCQEHGVGDLFLIAVQSAGLTDPRDIGFDAAVEFPPHGIPLIQSIIGQLDISNPDFHGAIFDYKQAFEAILQKPRPEYKLFNTVFTSWDNTPRMQDKPLIFHNGTPMNFQSWLTRVIKNTLEHCAENENFVFINAWNEWAEGAHLEPDRRYGYAFLHATANAINTVIDEKDYSDHLSQLNTNLNGFEKRHNTAVILHLYYSELWEEISSYLDNLQDDYDLLVSIPKNVIFSTDEILKKKPEAFIYHCVNRGRDIAPFLSLMKMVEKYDYKYVCKIHTKKSVHREDGRNWREQLLIELLGSSQKIDEIRKHLDCEDVGIIGPKGQLISTEFFMGGNETLISNVLSKLGLPYKGENFSFIAGSMYWFKPSAIQTINQLAINYKDFPIEDGQKDGTLAHALERVICFVSKINGYKVIETDTYSEIPNSAFPYAAPYQKES